MDQVTDTWLKLPSAKIKISMPSRIIIGTMDAVGAVLLLFFLAPVFVIVAISVYISDPGPIFFAHQRVGRGGGMFACLKFRTMVVDASQQLIQLLETDPAAKAEWDRYHKLRRDPRVTRLGRFLRKTSLDELPQLFNVLRREMSLVGPRPISLAEAPRYGKYIREYASVRPGISGLWQVSGRNDTSYNRRVALDVAFVKGYSVKMYLKIVFSTLPVVLFSLGSY